MSDNQEYAHSPSKRRRLSPPVDWDQSAAAGRRLELPKDTYRADGHNKAMRQQANGSQDGNVTLSATSKIAGQTVAPFLAKHIPHQYAPMGGVDSSGSPKAKDPNTKYCYRHRPDQKCRRQANEPSMEQLQHELEVLPQADKQAIAHVWSLFSAAPAKHRNLMLQGILTQCCFPQLSYLSVNVRELIRIDFLSALPAEVAFRVLCFLDTTSLCKAAQVSHKWRTLADDDVVWHRMCEQHIDRKCTKCGWGLPLLEKKILRASKRQIQLRATGQGLNEWSPNLTPYPESVDEYHGNPAAKQSSNIAAAPGYNAVAMTRDGSNNSHENDPQFPKLPSNGSDLADSYFKPKLRPWKEVYKDRFKICTNWKHGRFSTKIFKGHANGIMCLQFCDNLNVLATGSYDATIKMWDLDTCEEIRTLRGHDSGIRCLQFDDQKLISGGLDRNVKVWNWHTGECMSTYQGHSGGVIGLNFDGAILATGSMDTTIKIWNFQDKSTYVLRGHTDWVNAVSIDSTSRTLFSASDDFTVRLWDLDTRTCIKTFEGHVGQVQQVVALPPEFDFEEYDIEEHASSRSSAPSTQSDLPTAQPAAEDPSSSSNSFGPGFTDAARPLPPRYILTGALDSTVRLWDTATQKCLRTYFGHVEGIWALAADTLRIVSGAEDGMAKVWDARTGKCDRTFTGHAGPVTCLGLSDCRLCTGGEDCEVRMYCF